MPKLHASNTYLAVELVATTRDIILPDGSIPDDTYACVVSVGPRVTQFSVGDLIVPFPNAIPIPTRFFGRELYFLLEEQVMATVHETAPALS